MTPAPELQAAGAVLANPQATPEARERAVSLITEALLAEQQNNPEQYAKSLALLDGFLKEVRSVLKN